jgi:hypothetical protein
MKQDVLTLRLILMYRPMSITVTSRQLKCSLYHAAFQTFLMFMACTFKNTVILQNPSRATNYNRGTTEGLSVKTIDRSRFSKFTRRNSNKGYTFNINKHKHMYFSVIQVNRQRNITQANDVINRFQNCYSYSRIWTWRNITKVTTARC